MATALSRYFGLIREANEIRWAAGKRSYLCTNTGVEAYIRLLGELSRHLQKDTSMDPRELGAAELIDGIAPYLSPALRFARESTDQDFERNFKVAFGSGGPAAYFYQLCTKVREEHPTFAAEGLDEHLRQTADERRLRADEQVRQIQTKVPEFVVERLKAAHPGPEFLQRAVRNQDILVDPPYTVRHNVNGFIKYNETIFSWEDQIRLAEAVTKAASRGANVVVSNADHESIRELYQNLGQMIRVERYSVIGGGKTYRGMTTELAVLVGTAWDRVSVEDDLQRSQGELPLTT